MERRNIEQPVKVEERIVGEETKRMITGLGIAYFNESNPGTEYKLWDNVFERIRPGAFKRAIKTDDVRGLFNHDPSQVLGRTKSGTMRLSATDDGVTYEIDEADTTVFRDVAEHIRRGDVTGASFSFVVTDERWTRDKDGREIREIVNGELFDVGPVTYPAYAATEAQMSMRSDSHGQEARTSYDAWKAQEGEAERLQTRIAETELRSRMIDLDT